MNDTMVEILKKNVITHQRAGTSGKDNPRHSTAYSETPPLYLLPFASLGPASEAVEMLVPLPTQAAYN